MSPRATWRLERLGSAAVYDDAAGKVDWMAAGLPTVRADDSERRALDAADRTPPTCAPDTRLDALRPDPAGSAVIVVNDQQIVLGRIKPASTSTSADPSSLAEAVMETGPTTVRAHEPLIPLLGRMDRRKVEEIIVTTPEGRLLGVVHRDTLSA
jgi:CBS domain-containing protein